MTADVTYEGIKEVLAQHARLPVDVAGIGPDDNLYHAGMTSHAAVSFMIGLEESYDVEFPQDALRKETFASIAAVKGAVERLRRDLPSAPAMPTEPVA